MELKSTNFFSAKNQERLEERRLRKERLEKLVEWAKEVGEKVGVKVEI